jgi:hypothetical protein
MKGNYTYLEFHFAENVTLRSTYGPSFERCKTMKVLFTRVTQQVY